MPKITFEVDLRDSASSALEQIVAQAKAAGVEIPKAFDNAKPALDRHKAATTGLTGVIREERQEHRMRAFAIREGAGAVGALAGEQSGLAKTIQQGSGTLFEFDFALKALSEGISRQQGAIGTLGKAIGSLAMPVSIALGAFLLARQAIEADRTKAVELAKSLQDAQIAAGEIHGDKIQELGYALRDAQKEAREATKAFNDYGTIVGLFSTNFSVGIREDFDKIFGTAFAARYVNNLKTAAVLGKEAMAAERKKQGDEELKLDDEIQTARQTNAIQRVKDNEWASAKEKIAAEQKAQEIILGIKEDAEKRAVDMTKGDYDAIVKGIVTKYNDQREALERSFTVAYKAEARERESADDAEAQSRQVKMGAILADGVHVNEMNAALRKQQLELAQESGNLAVLSVKDKYDADRKRIQNTAEIQREILALDEQSALDEEARKEAKFQHMGQIEQRFNLQRQIDAARVQTSLAAVDKKEQDAQEKKWDSIEKMSDHVVKSLEQGFGNAIGAVIMQAENLGEAFVGVAKKIVEELIVMISEAIIFKALMGFLTGGASEISNPSLIGLGIGNLLPGAGAANGADFTVPGGFDNDSFPLRVSSGEHVRVTPAAESSQASGGPPVNIYVSAMDAKSFSDFIKQGSIKDAVMSAIRQQIGTGR